MGKFDTRALTDTEYDTFAQVLGAAFLEDSEADLARYRRISDFATITGAFEASEMIGVAGRFDKEIALPGGSWCPLAAVTTVGVPPGHRRRGVLTSLMRAQLDEFHAAGTPLAALFASETTIYGRYGYGMASWENRIAVPRAARFRPEVEVDERPVREVTAAHALPEIDRRYPQVARWRPGWLSRIDGGWNARRLLGDEAGVRSRFALHGAGHAVYRAHANWNERGADYRLEIIDLVAETPQAHAALWRYLLDVDLVGEVRWEKAAADEPLPHLLADSRVALQRITDGLWLRLVDLETALPARRYSAPVDVIFEVTDEFCPWNTGRWRLRADTSGTAEVSRSTEPAHIALGVAELAAAYLGGNSLHRLAAAGRIRELTPGTLAAASLALSTERTPHCPEGF